MSFDGVEEQTFRSALGAAEVTTVLAARLAERAAVATEEDVLHREEWTRGLAACVCGCSVESANAVELTGQKN